MNGCRAFKNAIFFPILVKNAKTRSVPKEELGSAGTHFVLPLRLLVGHRRRA
jgi:hypothetical protein